MRSRKPYHLPSVIDAGVIVALVQRDILECGLRLVDILALLCHERMELAMLRLGPHLEAEVMEVG